MREGKVTVTAARVHHPPVVPAFAYRFDAADRSIVISGDTPPSDSLEKLARGADVLVHEALYPSGVDRLVATVPNAADLKRSILSHHTSAEDLVPAEDPTITDQIWIDAAREHFRGQVILGKDLMEI
jgi:ribonuclease BN (tRNA processing enzyme)